MCSFPPPHLLGTCFLQSFARYPHATLPAASSARPPHWPSAPLSPPLLSVSSYYIEPPHTLSLVALTVCDPMFSRVQLFVTPWITARQASVSIANSRGLLRLMPIELVMPSSHLILCHPLLFCPQSLPASGSFPMSELFTSGGQSIGISASASVLPMNTQDWSPLGWTGWISLQSKGLSRVFSNTIFQKHQFFSTQLSSQSNSHIHIWPLDKP